MARVELPIVVLNNASPYNPVSGASAVVVNRVGGAQASVFSDSGATNTLITQPLTTDSSGRLTGWVNRGAYEVQITIPGKTAYAEEFDASPAADGGIDTAWLADSAVSLVKIASGAKDQAAATASLRTLGTGSAQATAGNDTRLSDQRTPLDTSVTTAKLADGSVTGPKAATGYGLIPTGAAVPFFGSSAPTGFLICDGSAVSRTTFATLFGVLGTSWGVGNGTTTFNLPDARGKVLAGIDSVSQLLPSNRALGNSGGVATSTLTTGNLPDHAHSVSDPGHAHGVFDPSHAHGLGGSFHSLTAGGSLVISGGGGTNNTAASGTGIGIFSAATGIGVGGISGGTANTPVAVVQPYLIVNWIVKT